MTDSARLAADTAMGAVTLDVADLDVMTRYYGATLGLDVLSSQGSVVVLGRAARGGDAATGGATGSAGAASMSPVTDTAINTAIVVLRHSPELRHAGPSEAGLFHTAILFETQAALAAAVYSVAQAYPGSFTGSSDHLVSQAFYFDDPEHNGVELYWDRDRTEWSWVHGTIEMSTLYLDPNAFLAEHLTQEAVDARTTAPATVGHVHLSVGDVQTAREFYVDRLGFDLTTSFGDQAVFVSAGGYHHHMAMNTWRSRGAGVRTRALGLGTVEIALPSVDELGAVGERLAHFGLPVRDDGAALEVDDPWGTSIRLAAR